MFIGFSFIILFSIIGYLNIHTHITCIVHDLSVLKVVQKIQVMNFL